MLAPILTTERLVLRPLCLSDAPAIQKYFSHWSVIQHLTTQVPWPYPDDGAQTYLLSRLPEIEANNDMAWAITEQGSSELIGLIEYRAGAELEDNRGFWLGQPWQGRGYMTECIYAVQDYLFFELQIERILVVNATDNLQSRRIKEKTGAHYLGQLPMEHRNGCRTSEQWEITREGWAQHRGKTP